MDQKRTLYEIGEDIVALDSLLFEVGGDVSEEDADAAITSFLNENRENLERKLDGYGYLIREQEKDAEFCEAEAERLSRRAEVRRNAVKRLKDRLNDFFTQHGLTKVQAPHFTLAQQKNGGKIPLEIKVQPEELPKPYRYEVVSVKADTDKIREALEAGKKLPFATLGERGTHIRVK